MCNTTQLQGISCRFTRRLYLTTTNRATMYSLDLLSLFRDPTNHPLGHDAFPVGSLATIIWLPPTRLQYVHRSYFCYLEVQPTAGLVMMYPL